MTLSFLFSLKRCDCPLTWLPWWKNPMGGCCRGKIVLWDDCSVEWFPVGWISFPWLSSGMFFFWCSFPVGISFCEMMFLWDDYPVGWVSIGMIFLCAFFHLRCDLKVVVPTPITNGCQIMFLNVWLWWAKRCWVQELLLDTSSTMAWNSDGTLSL